VPTYNELGQTLNEFKKAEKLYKNQTVATKWAEKREEELEELSAIKKTLDKNAVISKKFPVKPNEYRYPEHGLNIGNPLYMTTNMDIGRLKPSGYEVPEKYFPINRTFTNQFGGGNFKFNGLNTGVEFSKSHKANDEF